jgi:hypothetical protein
VGGRIGSGNVDFGDSKRRSGSAKVGGKNGAPLAQEILTRVESGGSLLLCEMRLDDPVFDWLSSGVSGEDGG